MDYEPTVWQDGDTITSIRLNKLEQGVAAMGYEPTIWQDGDTITSVRLNKLEQGVATLSGGTTLGALVDITSTATDDTSIQVSTRAYDISGETWREIDEATGNTNVFYVGSNSCGAPGGCYLMMSTAVPSEWSPESVQVTFNDDEISNFECRKGPTTEEPEPDRCLLTMQIPQDIGDLFIDLGTE